jgi:RND family efflux transporter MFP subunit
MIIIAELKDKNIAATAAAPPCEEPTVHFPRIPLPRPGVAARSAAPLVLTLFLALLAACSKDAPPPEDVRPVRAMQLAAGGAQTHTEFSGDVRPRYESRLGFRVAGKISARKVDVGATVKRGTLLMQLDPQDLRLGQAQATANLRAAQTNADLARAELKRYQDLRSQNFVSQAVLDQKIAAARSSQASVEAARALSSEQANQTGYANLESDTDGVVTGIDAEVGQVVAPGTPVVRVARTDEKEVVIGVPEDQVDELRQVRQVKVRLWADPNRSIAGKIREVAPVADPATRTYTVKVSIPASEEVRLGMTAVVELVHQASGGAGAQLRAPLSSLVQNKGASSVWVIENVNGAQQVRLQPVQVAGVAGNEVLLSSGVRPGQQIVTAGVNLLKNGQKVRILTADVARRGDAELDASGAAREAGK